jgi:hypothetical protein
MNWEVDPAFAIVNLFYNPDSLSSCILKISFVMLLPEYVGEESNRRRSNKLKALWEIVVK